MKTTELYTDGQQSQQVVNDQPEKASNSKYAYTALGAGLIACGGVFAWGKVRDEFHTSSSSEEGVTPDNTITENEAVISEQTPTASTANSMSEFGKAFAQARQEGGPGKQFEYEGNLYNTYYKDEWDALSLTEKKEFWASVNNPKEVAPQAEDQPITLRVATCITDDMDMETALYAAREEVGFGLFLFQGDLCLTYTMDELNNLPSDEHVQLKKLMGQAQISEHNVLNLDDISEIDMVLPWQAPEESIQEIVYDFIGDGTLTHTLLIDYDGDGFADGMRPDYDGDGLPDDEINIENLGISMENAYEDLDRELSPYKQAPDEHPLDFDDMVNI